VGESDNYSDYRLEDELGRGGMGIVYRAHRLSLNRQVALKMILGGAFHTTNFAKRLRLEAEATAALDHPNIVTIYEVGEHNGQPFFTMRLVEGTNLAQKLKAGPVTPHQAATLMVTVARAIQHAHERGVLHRDLKPSNILLDTQGQPHVTDFGLARIMHADSSLTLSQAAIGTPSYMAPEQAAGNTKKVTTAADIYSLGAILYELLTGRPLFRAETPLQAIRQVMEREPERPSRINPRITHDLETICLKCLEKDPARRYPSAQELAEELGRFLRHEPIHARPAGPVGRAWRWCRRKPVVAGMTAAVFALLLTVTVVSVSSARRIAAEAQRTEEKARELRLNLYVADMNVAYQAIRENNLARARQIIANYLPGAPREGGERAVGGQEDLRGWEWRYLWKLSRGDATTILSGHSNAVNCAVFSRDGKTLITAGFDQTVRIWDVATSRTVRVLTGFRDKLQGNSVALSPDGKSLAVADGTDIQVFETATWGRVQTLTNPTWPGFIESLPIAFSPDGKTLSCNAETEIRHWNTTTWEQLASQPTNLVDEFTRLLTYSPDGRLFATGKKDGVAVWDASSTPPRQRFLGSLIWPFAVNFSPDGRKIASGGVGGEAIVWNVETGEEIVRLPLGGTATLVTELAWSPDGRRLAVSDDEQVIRVWDMEQGKFVSTLRGSYDEVNVMVFSPDGDTLVSGCADGGTRLFSTLPQVTPETILTFGRLLGCSADGSVVVHSTNAMVTFWDAPSRHLLRSFKIPAAAGLGDSIIASRDVRLLAYVGADGIARVLNLTTGEQLAELALNPPPKWPWFAFSPDSRLLAISDDTRARGGGGWTLVCDLRSGERRTLPGEDVYRPSFSPDGSMLATGFGYDVRVWSVPGLRSLATFTGHTWTINGIAFSPDGTLLAAMGRNSQIILWEVVTGQIRPFNGLARGNGLTSAAFSRDGKTLVSGSNVSPELWNVATGKKLLPLLGTHRFRGSAMFSPDARTLLSGPTGGAAPFSPVELLEAPSMAEIEAAEGL
jgi:WD40 repeat protein